MPLTPLQRQFLEAAAELSARQHELLPLVTAALGRTPFDYWIRGDGRDDPRLGSVELTSDGEWRIRFHGLEFDLLNALDGRFVRVDFAPGGAPAFTPGGIGQFVVATRSPWRVFPALAAALSSPQGYDYHRCASLSEELLQLGLFSYTAPELRALVERSRTFVPGRGHVLDIPPDEMPHDESALLVCENLVLSDEGLAALRAGPGYSRDQLK